MTLNMSEWVSIEGIADKNQHARRVRSCLIFQFTLLTIDALITERMTSNSQIVNLYGYAGYSMITECFSNGDVEDDVVGMFERHKDFNPLKGPEVTRNNFTGMAKLKLALSMVEPVAALHNYKDGVIIHDDIQLSQYLWTDSTKTSVKLNDFNRAEVMFWDDEFQEYCKYRNGKGQGDVSFQRSGCYSAGCVCL